MKILLAVSSGIDSMYMANRAPELFPGASFAIAHCNFGLRGEDSDADEAFVLEWAAAHDLHCYVKRFKTEEYAAGHGISIEMAARALRYEWFGSLCREQGYDAVAVAHNANDNAETLMLNLLRGTGSRGLRGMSPDSSEQPVRVLRPLLGISRSEIRNWMTAGGHQWREDRTNSESIYKRNCIRGEVFPVFERLNPSFVGTLNSDMQRFREVDEIAEDYYRSCGLDPESIDIAKLKSSRHWQYLLYRLTEGKLGAEQLESLKDALQSGKPLGGKRFGPLVISAGRIVPAAITEGDICLTVEGPGLYCFKGRHFCIEELPAGEIPDLKQPSGVLVADASRLEFPFLLRGWADGDWLKPFGMKGRKKLSDLFTDLKMGQPEKERAVVAVSPALNSDGDSHVAALLCLRIDDSLKVTENTSTVLRITEESR